MVPIERGSWCVRCLDSEMCCDVRCIRVYLSIKANDYSAVANHSSSTLQDPISRYISQQLTSVARRQINVCALVERCSFKDVNKVVCGSEQPSFENMHVNQSSNALERLLDSVGKSLRHLFTSFHIVDLPFLFPKSDTQALIVVLPTLITSGLFGISVFLFCRYVIPCLRLSLEARDETRVTVVLTQGNHLIRLPCVSRPTAEQIALQSTHFVSSLIMSDPFAPHLTAAARHHTIFCPSPNHATISPKY